MPPEMEASTEGSGWITFFLLLIFIIAIGIPILRKRYALAAATASFGFGIWGGMLFGAAAVQMWLFDHLPAKAKLPDNLMEQAKGELVADGLWGFLLLLIGAGLLIAVHYTSRNHRPGRGREPRQPAGRPGSLPPFSD